VFTVPGARPAFIEFVQTFGDLVNFHPHVHVLAADGIFRDDGVCVELPPIPEAMLEGGFRRAVLDLLEMRYDAAATQALPTIALCDIMPECA
jgi:hypothetical protein